MPSRSVSRNRNPKINVISKKKLKLKPIPLFLNYTAPARHHYNLRSTNKQFRGIPDFSARLAETNARAHQVNHMSRAGENDFSDITDEDNLSVKTEKSASLKSITTHESSDSTGIKNEVLAKTEFDITKRTTSEPIEDQLATIDIENRNQASGNNLAVFDFKEYITKHD